MPFQSTWTVPTRRTFLGLAGAVAAAPLIVACNSESSPSSSSTEPLKFWNMPWGGPAFSELDKKLVEAYKPSADLPKATYQTIQWAGFNETFASAIASNTGPGVSSGGGTQAFQFESQGKIAYADKLLESWKENGLYDDFLPGLLDSMKTPNGYAAIPYNLGIRVLWYSKSLMVAAGAEAPTDWQTYLDACAALKKNDVYGFGIGSGAGNPIGSQILVSWMINNGGGLFDADRKPDCVTPANIEAMTFITEMVSKGYVDPASASYTSANVDSQWKAKKFGMGMNANTLATNLGGETGADLVLGSPLESPSGNRGTLYLPNNIMMYKDTPSQQSSEDFLTYYYKSMAPLWTENTGISLPPLKSITETPEFKANPDNVKIVDEWQPVGRTWAAPGGDGLFADVSVVDGTPAMITFSQSILSGEDAKVALTNLQTALESNVKS